MQFDVRLTMRFASWLDDMRDFEARSAISKRLVRVRSGNFGDHASVGGGVSELRIHVGAGYRAYYTIREGTVIFMLVGGSKKSQARDIEKARRMADDW